MTPWHKCAGISSEEAGYDGSLHSGEDKQSAIDALFAEQRKRADVWAQYESAVLAVRPAPSRHAEFDDLGPVPKCGTDGAIPGIRHQEPRDSTKRDIVRRCTWD